MTPLSGAERQRRYRERNAERLRQEKLADCERQRVLDLPPDARCYCCGETRAVFLASDVRCWNCAHAEEVCGVCPHVGLGRLG